MQEHRWRRAVLAAVGVACAIANTGCWRLIAAEPAPYDPTWSTRLSLAPSGDVLAVGWQEGRGLSKAVRYGLSGTRIVSTRDMVSWAEAVFPGEPAAVPPEVRAAADARVVSITCVDRQPAVCVVGRLYSQRDGKPSGTITVFDGTRRCEIVDRWRHRSVPVVSRDGSMVAFTGSETLGGPKAVYLVANEPGRCEPVRVAAGPAVERTFP